jgi:hypothetical protein
MNKPTEPSVPLNHFMLGRFVAQYEEGAAGFFIDADDIQEVALQVKAALSLGRAIMDQIDADKSIPTDVACKVFAAIKRANAARALATDTTGD